MNRETFQAIRDLLMEKLDMSREMTDREILDEIDQLILNRMRDSYISLNEKLQLRQELFYSVRKLDVLQELIEDETVTEIMVNGPDAIFVERGGRLGKWDKSFTSREKLEDVIQQIVGKCNRVINESMPIVDARLENGSRVNAVIYPVALNGPILTIRRFPEHPITMEKLIALGSITQECAEFLEKLVKARYSMVIGGGTGKSDLPVIQYAAAVARLVRIAGAAAGIDQHIRQQKGPGEEGGGPKANPEKTQTTGKNGKTTCFLHESCPVGEKFIAGWERRRKHHPGPFPRDR